MDSSRAIPADVAPFATLAALVSEGVLELDGQHRIISGNACVERILGYAQVSLEGKSVEELLHPDNAGDPFAAQSTLLLRDTVGAAVPVQARYARHVLVFSPAARVDEIEQLKNEIVSTVSHELKTPLSTIKAYAATLREHPAVYESHRDEFLGVVEEQADRLARVVDDMLDVSRVETEHLLRRRVRVKAARIIDEALLGIAYNPVRHPIVYDLGDLDLSGDPERLRDLFRNLIENAIKYSPSGGTIVLRGSQDESASEIEVEDRGIGIEAADLPYIYERFFRAADDVGAGSGLGLYIASAIVRAHGGNLGVRSTPGKGTVFTVRLPLR